MNGRIESLGLIQSACWRELERAAHERGHEWRQMAVATAHDGGADLRTMVLREGDQIELEREVPSEFYKAIAEIFSYVYELKKKR